MRVVFYALRATLACALLVLSGCGDDPAYKDKLFTGSNNASNGGAGGSGGAGEDADEDDDAGVDTGDGGTTDSGCELAVASDKLPARFNVMSRRTQGGGQEQIFTSDLFGLFASNCGGCHVDNMLGGLKVSLMNFPDVITQEALDRLTSDDPAYFMPPNGAGGKPFSERAPGDPVVELAGLFEAWLAAGRPRDVFYPSSGGSAGSDPSRYLLSEEVGLNLTNLGHCIPTPDIVGTETQKTRELDEMFEGATELPGRLEETDLFTLDTEVLARHRVIAFAPAYTLWADNAKKIRMVRVPMGESIEFDREKQRFDIPPNTRFYKTFLKHVVDLHGRESYRKIETRLIVSRPDVVGDDGVAHPTALFGTYKWNEDETEAELVRDPLRNGEPFRDHLLTVITDEAAADEVISQGPDDLQHALQEAGLTRTYAIPGSERCIQCHMGAPNGSFVLGMLPLQILRRPLGEGGVIEPAERDELNQLQRLIDYKVITGMDSPDDVKRLEDSEGDRKPRNDFELTAQAYMVGNCAHCHNPRGYPSQVAPELRELLNFMPSADGGGVFQFPLERFSPRITHGLGANVRPIPYITPSMYDAQFLSGTSNYVRKFVIDPAEPIYPAPITAPWRSLIYRNVDTPFTYEEDFAIYPRMPMNTPGYDCRVRRIMASWMLGIPAKLKVSGDTAGKTLFQLESQSPENQPYEEVTPSDPSFDRFRRAAEKNVRDYLEGPRANDCPDPSLDIVDPRVVGGEVLTPTPSAHNVIEPSMPGEAVPFYELRTPARPHWAVTDLTEPPGEWNPRRPDWNEVLVDLDIDMLNPTMQDRIRTIQSVHVTEEFASFALEERPFALFEAKQDCDFSGVKKVGDLENPPRWIDIVHPPASAPVYEISRGGHVFNMICLHCHGPLADSKGRLAATIADMTGGQTRVANLRDGFFGPPATPGDNRSRVYGEYASATDTADDWAARYMLWMGLGGTQRTIPSAALDAIKGSDVLGTERPSPQPATTDANMLSVAMGLCKQVLPAGPGMLGFLPTKGAVDLSSDGSLKPVLIQDNYDSEFWEELCSLDNEPRPIRVIDVAHDLTGLSFTISQSLDGSLRDRSAYPSDAVIGDQLGHTRALLDDSNTAPWCFKRPATQDGRDALEAMWEEHAAGEAVPYCPLEGFLEDPATIYDSVDSDRWGVRGAMNAGLSVFVYLRALTRGEITPKVPYNRCENL